MSDIANLPKGVIPITMKDGSTIYSYQGKDYDNVEDIRGFLGRPLRVSKTANQLGEKVSQFANKPIVRPIAGLLTKIGEVTELPGEEQFVQKVGESAQQWGLPAWVGEGLGYAVYPGLGEFKMLKGIPPAPRSIQKLHQKLVPIGAGDNVGTVARNVDNLGGLPNPAQPLKLQKDLVPSQTLKNIPIGSAPTDIAKQLPSKYYNQLNPQYRYITKSKLSKDEALLGTLRGREETIDTLWTKLQELEAEKVELKTLSEKLSLTELKKLDYNLYRKIKLNRKYIKETSKDIQDTAAYNIFGTDKRIYMTDAVRTKLKNQLKEFSGGDEWHHIFNSKDAGEYMLTEVAQDPLIAANLFQHMKKLKLDSSGIASNLALMRKVPHGKWHKLMKDTGVEPAGFIKDLQRWKRAELSLAEYGNDIAAAVKAGKTDVNELFTLLEKYKLFQDELSKELFTKYGAKKFSDIPGVQEIIESHSFKTSTGR